MAVLFIHEKFLHHETGHHPECPERLISIDGKLKATGLKDRFTAGQIRSATPSELQLVHSSEYIQTVESFAQSGGGRIETDTVVSSESFEVACLAAGTAIEAVDQVLSGTHDRAVCLIRPPGHHALPSKAMGFCLFGNVAIAARYAQKAYDLDRVLIVDWDVHHGNGTQDVFYEDGQVYFFSAHRWPFYPGTGAQTETGRRDGLGATFNLPMTFGITRKDYYEAFHSVLRDAVSHCRPQLILLSAGFDAHAADPVGSLGLESEDFGPLTELLIDAANQYCEGRLISLLEGGYDLEALAESVAVHLETLAPENLTP